MFATQDRLERWLSTRHGIQKKPIRIERRQIYILPTPIGWAFGGSLMIMLLWSINYNSSMGYALTFLLAAIGLNTLWRTHNTLLGLRIRPLPSNPVFVSESAGFRFQLGHDTPPIRYGIGMSWYGQSPHFVDVPGGGVELALPILALQRGWLDAGPVRLTTRFPLGLFQAWSWIRFDQRCLIYPQPIGHRKLPEGGSGQSQYSDSQARNAGQDDYAGLRAYVPGDSSRHVAWRASARSDNRTLLVKRFDTGTDHSIWLDFNKLAPLSTEARISQLCVWVLEASTRGQPYGLHLPDQTLSVASGVEHRESCLKALALYEAIPSAAIRS